MASLLNMSGGSLLNKGLPYDAEIEYLKGDGNAYIILPFIGYSNKTTFELEFKAYPAVSCSIIGSRKDTNSRFCWVIEPNSTWTQVGYGNDYYNIDIPVSRNDITNIKTEILSNEIRYTITNKTTGVSGSKTCSLANFDVLDYIYLFWSSALYKSASSIIKCIIKNDDTTVIDSYPVRKGNVGYMYDSVSGQLFGNNGTGDFILGPDKLPLSGIIDMGLPSGTLWAQGNIVKDANGNYAIGEPTDYGAYFSWGNIDGHNEGDGYSFNEANYALTPGSQLTGDIPSDDALHDAAVARIGGGFHLPSGDQMTELFNSEYTTNEWTTLNGVYGRRVTSLINGNSIFIPAAGYRYSTSFYNDSTGSYWLSRWRSASNAYRLNFGNGNVSPQISYRRYYGFSVRAVHN